MKQWAVFCGAIMLPALVLTHAMAESDLDDYANRPDSASLVKAPDEVIKSAADTCRSWAKDDQIEQAELAAYLLICVNEELNYQGYSSVTSID